MSDPDPVAAWVLTRALTPRDRVRVAATFIDGEILNDYDHTWSVNELPPVTPWAMYLADDDHRYRYLCFDLDSSKGNAPYDAGKLSLWLDELNIDHLVCESGPTGGRHLWLGLAEPAHALAVKNIALLATSLLPALDPIPLSNPATGCVRPPGAPHRLGGVSVARGPLAALTSTPVTLEQLDALRDFLVDLGAEIPAPNTAPLRGMAVDDDGHPYITGPKRALSPRLTMMLDAPAAADASYTLATVLAGCAHARWRHDDVLALVDQSPALEHVRSLRGRGGDRIPRSSRGRIRALDSAWATAVRYVAAHPLHGTGDDTDYLARSNRALTAVQRAQERADAMPGLWGADRASSAARGRAGTHSTRAVLDALCLYVAQSAQLVVEADVRRLSADTGYGRSTVHTALQALARPVVDGAPESAWIVRVGEAAAPHGQRYRLSERFSTDPEDSNRTQVLARPAPSATPTRSYWLVHLTRELHPLAHDTFAAPRSLGRTAGLVFKNLSPEASVTVDELTRRSGLDAARTRSSLHRLHSHGLVRRDRDGWTRADVVALDGAASALDVAGYLEARRDRYSAERAVWGWWQAEYAWMTKANKKRRHRRTATGLALFAQNDRPDYAQYPRGPDRRGDHREARRLVAAGALSPTTLSAAA